MDTALTDIETGIDGLLLLMSSLSSINTIVVQNVLMFGMHAINRFVVKTFRTTNVWITVLLSEKQLSFTYLVVLIYLSLSLSSPSMGGLLMYWESRKQNINHTLNYEPLVTHYLWSLIPLFMIFELIRSTQS